MKLIIWLFLLTATSFQSYTPWVSLLDKDLSRWETYLSYRHTRAYKGGVPVDDQGSPVSPIGYNKDSTKVFSVQEQNGDLVLRISGEIYGCIFTKQEFDNYHLKLKVKWGTRKFVPREDKLKDSGILYLSTGPAGVDYWKSWMLSQEFQIMEGHMGDYWNIANACIDIRSYPAEGVMSSIASRGQPFRPYGNPNPQGFCMRSEDHESPNNDWTTLELICHKGRSLHIVNGHVVMVLQNSRYFEDGKYVPLLKGKIQLHSEAAEVLFKDIQIRNIQSLPKSYVAYFD